ncbi:MAG TPA: hypothetical protein VEI82_02305 [Myxococcota bacterium]|nr:hypothetical protein [Myxococcota bacterium]
MKHAGPAALDQIEELLAKLRAYPLKEKSRGTFYRGSSAFLHFHEDPAGMFADLKRNGDFERFRVSTKAECAAFLRMVARELAPPAAQSRDTRRGG